MKQTEYFLFNAACSLTCECTHRNTDIQYCTHMPNQVWESTLTDNPYTHCVGKAHIWWSLPVHKCTLFYTHHTPAASRCCRRSCITNVDSIKPSLSPAVTTAADALWNTARMHYSCSHSSFSLIIPPPTALTSDRTDSHNNSLYLIHSNREDAFLCFESYQRSQWRPFYAAVERPWCSSTNTFKKPSGSVLSVLLFFKCVLVNVHGLTELFCFYVILVWSSERLFRILYTESKEQPWGKVCWSFYAAPTDMWWYSETEEMYREAQSQIKIFIFMTLPVFVAFIIQLYSCCTNFLAKSPVGKLLCIRHAESNSLLL